MYDEIVLFLDELLLNRQVKDYSFLAKGCVSVDDVDDADMFKQTEVSIQPLKYATQTLSINS